MLEILKSRARKTRDRIMAYKPLESEPEEAEAESRTLMPSAEQVSEEPSRYVPEGQFSVAEYARGSGMSRYKSAKAIKELLEEKTIELVPSSGKQPRYQIIGGGPNPSKVTELSVPDGSEEQDIDYVNITNSFIWQFIRETRTTDVLLFLTWLERKAGR